MKPPILTRLDEFVNRETELRRFLQILDHPEAGIMVIYGDGGVGKSTLLARIVHEIAQRGIRKSEVVWTDTRNHDYLAVMRKIRDDIGVKEFKQFTDLVNYFTVPQYELKLKYEGPAAISVLSQADINGSQTGDIAGIIIKDMMLTDSRSDMQISKAEQMAPLTDAFLNCLANVAAKESLVMLFDAVEKMSEETETWIWNELLAAARDERLGQVKFVLCGRKEPSLDRSWRHIMDVARLEPFTREHVIKYLEKRGVQESGREQLADLLLVVTHGNMLEMATHIDSYLKICSNQKSSF